MSFQEIRYAYLDHPQEVLIGNSILLSSLHMRCPVNTLPRPWGTPYAMASIPTVPRSLPQVQAGPPGICRLREVDSSTETQNLGMLSTDPGRLPGSDGLDCPVTMMIAPFL